MKSINEPFYELEIKSANCNVEIIINSLPIFSHYDNGSIAVDYPINDAILESAKQSLIIRVLSPKEHENISNYANVEVKVYVKEANIEASGRNLVYEVPAIDFKEKRLPVSESVYSLYPLGEPRHC